MNLIDSWSQLYLENKFKIEEMADSIKDIKQRITDSRLQILTHLVKLYLWPNDKNNYNHWKSEIHSFLPSMPLIKSKNKYPTTKQLMNWGFQTTLESIRDQIDLYTDKAFSDEAKPIINFDKVQLQSFMSNYIMWLCSELGDVNNNGKVTKTQVSKKLDQLLNK